MTTEYKGDSPSATHSSLIERLREPLPAEPHPTKEGWVCIPAMHAEAAGDQRHEAADALENYVGICNAWKRDYDGEKARGDAWMADCKKAQALISETAMPKAGKQYYFHDNSCPASFSGETSCICWHNAGTGPLSAEEQALHLLSWREATPSATPMPEVLSGCAVRAAIQRERYAKFGTDLPLGERPKETDAEINAGALRKPDDKNGELVRLLDHVAFNITMRSPMTATEARIVTRAARALEATASATLLPSIARRCRPAVAHYMRTQERAAMSTALSAGAKQMAENEAAWLGKLLDEIDSICGRTGPHEPPRPPNHFQVA